MIDVKALFTKILTRGIFKDSNGDVTLTGGLTLAADPSASMEAATKHYVDSKFSFVAPDGISWSSLGNNWTPSASGIATTRINPSNSSSAYLLIRDSSNGNTPVAQVATTAGLGASMSWPVIKGHTYTVGGHSTNVTSMETRLYVFA